jgi:hypothetical protein
MALVKRRASSGSAEAQIKLPAAILAVIFQSLRLFRGKYHKTTAAETMIPAARSRSIDVLYTDKYIAMSRWLATGDVPTTINRRWGGV